MTLTDRKAAQQREAQRQMVMVAAETWLTTGRIAYDEYQRRLGPGPDRPQNHQQ